MANHLRLRELARNLYWTWHPEVADIFRDLEGYDIHYTQHCYLPVVGGSLCRFPDGITVPR